MAIDVNSFLMHEIVESPLEGLFLHGDGLIDVSERGRHFVRSPKSPFQEVVSLSTVGSDRPLYVFVA